MDRARLRAAIASAVQAPSAHNTQPWRFRIGANAIDLLADRGRALAVVDPHHRELTISCGACLYHLVLALRYDRLQPVVATFPDPTDPDLLARIQVGAGPRPTADDARLFAAIPERHTNRLAFAERLVPRAVQTALQATAAAEGAWLHLATSEAERDAIAGLVAQGDKLQFHDLGFRRELAAWVHPNRSPRRDGIPGSAFGMSDLLSYAGPAVIRGFDLGSVQARVSRRAAIGSPVLAVLGTHGDEPSDWLTAGQALARVLLQAQTVGLAASFLNQPIQVDALRPRLARTIGRTDAPQVLLRLGYGSAVSPTPRRAADAVIDDRQEES